MKEKMYGLIMGMMIILTIGCTVGTIRTNAVDTKSYDIQYMNKLEENYKKSLQKTLAEEGFIYSGITMTKTFEQSGIISYKIKLHNERLNQLSEEETIKLIKELEEIRTSSEIDEFRKDFLILNS